MGQSAAQASAFYTEVLADGSVWAIRDEGGHPAPKNGSGQRVMPFWSKESRAQKVVDSVPAYSAFEVVQIPLEKFESNWLPGLARDGLLIGLNWSGPRATGYDLAPDDVKGRLEAERSH